MYSHYLLSDRPRTSHVLATAVAALAGAGLAACAGGASPDSIAALETVAPVVSAPVVSESSPPSTAGTSASTSAAAPAVSTTPTAPPVSLPAVTEVTVIWEPSGESELPVEVVNDDALPSSIGDLHVTLVRNVEDTELAELSGVVPAPHGFAALWDGQLLMSADAVTWQPVDSPFPGRVLSLWATRPGQFWLTHSTPEGVVQRWTSADLERWNLVVASPDVSLFTELLDGPGLLRADIDQSLPLPDGSMLAKVTVELDLQGQIVSRLGDADTRLRFAEGGSEIWWEPEPGGTSGRLCAAVIRGMSWGTCDDALASSVASVEVELSISGTPDAWVLDVVDPASGDSLGAVHGLAIADDLAATLKTVTAGIVDWFVIDGGAVDRVVPDWADPNDPYYRPNFTETADGLLVYDFGGSVASGETDIWRTTDGFTWEHLSGDRRQEQTGYSVSKIDVSPAGGLVATVYGDEGAATVLLSADGVAWRPAAQPPVPPVFPDYTTTGIDPKVRVNVTERGFVYFAQGGDQLAVWTSPDGDVWEPVDVSAFTSTLDPDSDPFEQGGGSYGSVEAGNVVVVSILVTGGADVRWVIAVE
jgi:hypothetical protein